MQQGQVSSNSILDFNYSVASSLSNLVISSFGPNGSFKYVITEAENTVPQVRGNQSDDIRSVQKNFRLSKKGNEILQNIKLEHPIGNLIARVCNNQNEISGDGTTTVVLLIALLVEEGRNLINKGMRPTFVASCFEDILEIASEKLEQMKIPLLKNPNINESASIGDIVVELDEKLLYNLCYSAVVTKAIQETTAKEITDLCMKAMKIVMEKKTVREIKGRPFSLTDLPIVLMHGNSTESIGEVIKGFVVNQGARHPQMPTMIKNPRVLALEDPLEYSSKSGISNVQFQSNEDRILFIQQLKKETDSKIQAIIDLGINVVISSTSIDDICLGKLAKAGIFALRHMRKDNFMHALFCLGSNTVSSVQSLSKKSKSELSQFIGEAKMLETKVVRSQPYTFFLDTITQRQLE